MLRSASFIAALLLADAAVAQSRPVTTSMSCAQARAVLGARGAAVLSTGPYTFDRYVSGGGFCAVSETAEPAWVRTADSPQCFIGYRCRPVAEKSAR